MKPVDGHTGRLAQRYVLEPPIKIRWDTAPRRLPLLTVDMSRRAEIRDISALGVLIVITARVDTEFGAVVQIQRGGKTGLVRVRRVDTDGFGTTFVGVEFVDVGDALPDLHEIVCELRSADDSLDRVWERAR